MVIKLNPTDITANWSSGVQGTGDVAALRVQIRGTGFTGSVSIKQGESATALTETKASGALAGYTGSTEYYDLRPSSIVQVDVTRAAGTINEVLLAWGGKR
ncbi:MAG TPA: hypothetical protein PK569_20455 [Thermoanaerobaculia bacterium]|nr:hypothetical protein [Thermoanaerobaculia bacterium]